MNSDYDLEYIVQEEKQEGEEKVEEPLKFQEDISQINFSCEEDLKETEKEDHEEEKKEMKEFKLEEDISQINFHSREDSQTTIAE